MFLFCDIERHNCTQMCAHWTQQKWGRGLPVRMETSCLSISSAVGIVNRLKKFQLPQPCTHMPTPVALLSPFCSDERSVGVKHFLGHCNLRDPFYLNCWSVCSWWLVMDTISCWNSQEQFQWIPSDSFSVFPVTSQHLPFARGPGESSGVLSFSHLLVQGCCLIAQATLVIEMPHNWVLCSAKSCELGRCERFKRSSSIITEIPKNNYHACIGKWLLSERELCRMYIMCAYRTWLIA